jgi:hypothetical protein
MLNRRDNVTYYYNNKHTYVLYFNSKVSSRDLASDLLRTPEGKTAARPSVDHPNIVLCTTPQQVTALSPSPTGPPPPLPTGTPLPLPTGTPPPLPTGTPLPPRMGTPLALPRPSTPLTPGTPESDVAHNSDEFDDVS